MGCPSTACRARGAIPGSVGRSSWERKNKTKKRNETRHTQKARKTRAEQKSGEITTMCNCQQEVPPPPPLTSPTSGCPLAVLGSSCLHTSRGTREDTRRFEGRIATKGGYQKNTTGIPPRDSRRTDSLTPSPTPWLSATAAVALPPSAPTHSQRRTHERAKTEEDSQRRTHEREDGGRLSTPHAPPTLVAEVATYLALELHAEAVQLVEPVGDGLAVPAERKVEGVVDRALLVALLLLLLKRPPAETSTLGVSHKKSDTTSQSLANISVTRNFTQISANTRVTSPNTHTLDPHVPTAHDLYAACANTHVSQHKSSPYRATANLRATPRQLPASSPLAHARTHTSKARVFPPPPATFKEPTTANTGVLRWLQTISRADLVELRQRALLLLLYLLVTLLHRPRLLFVHLSLRGLQRIRLHLEESCHLGRATAADKTIAGSTY